VTPPVPLPPTPGTGAPPATPPATQAAPLPTPGPAGPGIPAVPVPATPGSRDAPPPLPAPGTFPSPGGAPTLSRRACDPPLYEDRVMRQPRIAYFGCTLALQPKHSPLLPTLARHFTGIILPVGTCQTFIPNSFSAFRNAIFSLASRGKSTARNQSV
jgi:hypothetical protein